LAAIIGRQSRSRRKIRCRAQRTFSLPQFVSRDSRWEARYPIRRAKRSWRQWKWRLEAAAVGIEPAVDFDATGKLPCGCVICDECRAAMALQSGRTEWLEWASLDADLQRVIASWTQLPPAIRVAIAAIVQSQL
jgi:hypothetical protein